MIFSNNMKFKLIPYFLGLSVLISCARTVNTDIRNTNEATIIFYNVENLFDTIDDPHKLDNDFLPNGRYNWNTERYNNHLTNTARLMDNLDNILAMGICEIENREVLEDLLKVQKNKKLAIVHHESPDRRGIDVALFYDSTRLKRIKDGVIRFTLNEKEKPTRDIMWAKFDYQQHPIYFLINHWPSRIGGDKKSEPNRIKAANLAAQFIDSIENIDPNASFFFMGDLNGYPNEKATQIISSRLQPMINSLSGEYGGTYNYRGEWEILDHMMVSNNLFGNTSLRVKEGSGQIISFPYLIENYKGKQLPFRIFAGGKYLGGFSDHLPIIIKVILN